MSSPTQRSKAYAESLGYTVAIVEKWNPWSRVRQDLYGFGDLLCMKAGEPALIVQTTSTANMGNRIKKIQSLDASVTWLATGNDIQVWGWSKRGPRGRKKKWAIKIYHVGPTNTSLAGAPQLPSQGV